MKLVAGLFFAGLLTVGVAVGGSSDAQAPAPMIATTTTSTSAIVVAPLGVDADAKCGQWWSVAVAAGWEEKDLRDLDDVLWRESRCDATQVNANDPNTVDGVKGSVGLMQINVFWVQQTKFFPLGYLQTVSVVRDSKDLFDPLLNLRAGKAVFDYGLEANGCGWSAWAWKGCD